MKKTRQMITCAIGLTLATLVGSVAAAPQEAFATETYGLYVGGVQVTSDNAAGVTGAGIQSGTVTFTPETEDIPATLTLSNAVIDMSAAPNTTSARWTNGIYAESSISELVVNINGICSIKSKGYSEGSKKSSEGIYCENAKLTLRGTDGKDANRLTISSPINEMLGRSLGAYSRYTMKIDGLTLSVSSSNVTNGCGFAATTSALAADDDIIINKSTVTAKTGYASDETGRSIAVDLQGHTLVVSNSTLNAEAASVNSLDNDVAVCAKMTVPMATTSITAKSDNHSMSTDYDMSFTGNVSHLASVNKNGTSYENYNADRRDVYKYAFISGSVPTSSIKYPLYVGGVQVTNANKEHVKGATIQGGVEFIPDNAGDPLTSGLLMLTNARVEGNTVAGNDKKLSSGIWAGYMDSVRIELFENNEVLAVGGTPTSGSSIPDARAIYAEIGKIEIYGEKKTDVLNLGMRGTNPGAFIGLYINGVANVHGCTLNVNTPDSGAFSNASAIGVSTDKVSVSDANIDILVDNSLYKGGEAYEAVGIKAMRGISLVSVNGKIAAVTRGEAAPAEGDTLVSGLYILNGNRADISGTCNLTVAGATWASYYPVNVLKCETQAKGYTSFTEETDGETYDVALNSQYKAITLGDSSPIVSGIGAAQTVADGTYVITIAGNDKKALDVKNASVKNFANVQLWDANGTSAQKFRVRYVPSKGAYEIVNDLSGKALDVNSAKFANGTNVSQYTVNNSIAQLWNIVPADNGAYEIVCAGDDSYALDRMSGSSKNGTNVRIYARNNSAAQKWKLSPTQPASELYHTIPDGSYTIYSKAALGKVVDVEYASRKACKNVRLWDDNKSVAQRFRFVYDNEGYYTIINTNSGMALDVKSGSKKSGANVWQYPVNGTAAQKWQAKVAPDGSYCFKNKASGKMLDLANGKKKAGTNIQIWTANQSDAQKWVLVK